MFMVYWVQELQDRQFLKLADEGVNTIEDMTEQPVSFRGLAEIVKEIVEDLERERDAKPEGN